MSGNATNVFARLLSRRQFSNPQNATDAMIEALCIVGNFYESANATSEPAGTNLADKFVSMLVAAGVNPGSLQVQAIRQRLNSVRSNLGN